MCHEPGRPARSMVQNVEIQLKHAARTAASTAAPVAGAERKDRTDGCCCTASALRELRATRRVCDG